MRAMAALLLGLWGSSCAPPPTPTARYAVEGQLIGVQLDTGEVLLKHGEIPGYMGAMTMPFRVSDIASIRERRPGDLIAATLIVGADRSWLEEVRLVGKAPLPDVAAARPVAEGIQLLAAGDPVPNVALTSHHGTPVSLTQWRGSAGVVTFIYTRCPLPDFCPLLDRRFAEIDKAAQSDPALRDRIRLLSVSFDPDFDSIEVLASHAAHVGAGPHWQFATAPADTVDRFAAAFGVNVIREADATITHNLRTAVVDPTGHVFSVRSGNAFTAADLLADLRSALAETPTTP